MKKLLTPMRRFLEKEVDPAFARRARIIFENLELEPGMRVLDVGCGRGFYEMAIARLFPRAEIVGIDANRKYLQQARGRVNADFQEADARWLPFSEESFDRVICSEVLEHIQEDNKAIEQIFRVLKKGGKVLITVPNKNYPFFWDPLNFVLERGFQLHIPSNIWWLAGIWADHVRLYDEAELLRKLEKAGFTAERLWRTTHYCLPFSHFLLYGVGKNLVEQGVVGKSFNRFELEARSSFLNRAIRFPFHAIDRFNEMSEPPGRPTMNLCVKARKPRP